MVVSDWSLAAGLGVGLMVYAPVGLWETNPLTVSGQVAPKSEETIEGAYRYTSLHTGFHAWAIYVVTGLCLAYYANTRGMPLTIRAALTPLLREYSNGIAGHAIYILGVVATKLGVAVTIGYGVSQMVDAANLSDATKTAAYDAGTQGRLFEWQAGWTTFYWA